MGKNRSPGHMCFFVLYHGFLSTLNATFYSVAIVKYIVRTTGTVSQTKIYRAGKNKNKKLKLKFQLIYNFSP